MLLTDDPGSPGRPSRPAGPWREKTVSGCGVCVCVGGGGGDKVWEGGGRLSITYRFSNFSWWSRRSYCTLWSLNIINYTIIFNFKFLDIKNKQIK